LQFNIYNHHKNDKSASVKISDDVMQSADWGPESIYRLKPLKPQPEEGGAGWSLRCSSAATSDRHGLCLRLLSLASRSL
jgi:hypothetical protein